MSRTQEIPSSSNTVTVIPETETDSLGQVVLKLKKPITKKVVKWTENTIDNEHMNKRKSNCCCIYKKPKVNFDDSSSDSDDECENCFGHVEVKRANRLTEPTESIPPEPSSDVK